MSESAVLEMCGRNQLLCDRLTGAGNSESDQV